MSLSSFSAMSILCALLLVSVRAHAGELTTTPDIHEPKRHTGFMADIQKMNGAIDVVFVGDSITDGWRSTGKAVWDKYFEPLKTLNLGISGDRTEHVLWRMQNGELDGYKAKLFMIMIGTNNSQRDSAPSIAHGVQAIINEIQSKQPQAKILLLAVFPRADKKTGKTDKLQAKNVETNKLICKFDDGKNLRYLDINSKFLSADGKLPKDIMPDFLHPNAKGYQIWADAVIDPIKQLLSSK